MTRLLGILACTSAALLLTSPALAGTTPDGKKCDLGKYFNADGRYLRDANGNGVWNGAGGGDQSVTINANAGAGAMLQGDWNGDMITDSGKVATGHAFNIDLNGNAAWDGNGGGDRRSVFASFADPFLPISGDWGLNGKDDIGKFRASNSQFVLDLNGNGTWEGPGGGDQSVVIANVAGPGNGITGDWNGDGRTNTGKVVGNAFYVDLNGNGQWDGAGGGDRRTTFAAFESSFVPIVGNWTGTGGDKIGKWVSASGKALLDANGNGIWDGVPGGDISVTIAVGGAGDPIVCDMNGDNKDNVGKVINSSSTYYWDLNGSFSWDGNAGGDRRTVFASGLGVGDGVGGVWTLP